LLLPDADILIAATACEEARLLVTGNTSHFERFPELKIGDWIH
jgi:predicted nucleic acid-binding protein